MNILIIDDDESLGEALVDILNFHGFQTHLVGDARAGLEALGRNEPRYSIVVLDFEMPGMNGEEFSKKLRCVGNAHANIPVILCSGHDDIQKVAERLPVSAIFSKPLDLDRFIETIGRLLKEPATPIIRAATTDKYLIRRAEDLEMIAAAMKIKDDEKVKAIAHRIKGSASTFGFPELTEIATRLETAILKSDWTNADLAFQEFKAWAMLHHTRTD